jgi:hypothetical protein
MRRTTIAAGALYFVTHVTSVTALVLYGPVLDHPASAPDTRVLVGGLLEVICAMAVLGTAVALYPALKRHSPGGALGYAALRTLEAATILTGVVTLLGVVTLRQHNADTVPLAGPLLVAVHNWTFLIGQGLVVGVDTVVLAYVLFRFRLVPRAIPILGLVGGPIVFASNLGVMFGAYPQESAVTGAAALPVFAWEVSLALYLIVKGLRLNASPRPVPVPVPVPVG